MNISIKIDFVVRKDTPYRRREFSRRKKVAVDDQDLYVVSPEDLILSKLDWAKDSRSEVQLNDVRNLLKSVKGLNQSYSCPLGKGIKHRIPLSGGK